MLNIIRTLTHGIHNCHHRLTRIQKVFQLKRATNELFESWPKICYPSRSVWVCVSRPLCPLCQHRAPWNHSAMWVSCSHWLWLCLPPAEALTRRSTHFAFSHFSALLLPLSLSLLQLPPKRRRFHAFASLRFAGQQAAGTRQPVGGTQRVACGMWQQASPGRRFKQLTRHAGTGYALDAGLISSFCLGPADAAFLCLVLVRNAVDSFKLVFLTMP